MNTTIQLYDTQLSKKVTETGQMLLKQMLTSLDIHASGGYTEGTQEGYEAAKARREESIMYDQIKQLASQVDRIRDFYSVGPVQRAALEEFAKLVWDEAYQQGLDVGAEEAILKERG